MFQASDEKDNPMKYLRYYLLILFVSILPFIGIFSTADLPHTSDGGVHLPRMAAYYKALTDGHIPVRWAGDLNYGYGLPLFNFMYHTPYLLSSFFLFLGFGLVPTFKIVLALSYVLSGVFMFAFSHAFFRDEKKALLVTIFYQFAPFRLVDILVRGALGGIYAYTFFPLVLCAITGFFRKQSVYRFSVTALSAFLLIISHNSLSLMFFALCILFTFFFPPSSKIRILTVLSLLLGLMMASFYWMPALLEHKYTYGDLFMKDLYKSHFPPLVNFFIPNLTNAVQLRTAEISVQLGIFHTAALLTGIIILLIKKPVDKTLKKLILFSLLILAGTFFFMQPISLPLWERVSFLRQFQFPWRLLAIACFATAMLSVTMLNIKFFKKPVPYLLLLALTIITTVYYWQPTQGYDKVREEDFWNYPLNTTYFGETDVIWSAGPAHEYPKERVQAIEGNAQIINFIKKTHVHTFAVDASTGTKLVDHTQYFPGWRVYVDGQKVPVEFQNQLWRGLITFPVPAGLHSVKVVFEESKVRSVADALSIVSFVALACMLIYTRVKRVV